ncbi:putative membrane protein [Rhodobacter aestuarii]|uniref:Uncharacterized membrane protein n=1 Tax=Rhodobacter aestuarii TaxID=453582 RepID=A0A1N7JBZ8_9RHOB|nr:MULTISPECIES: DUF502 domain-containing protein [Rhodobacter]PTV96957.1 putative membrane protein [Rhodobacter aestuarii]SIS46804.1 Uncharacterized membrane protein [Rhodobacter aestuarii]SOB98166.1 uncharacterized membrane protein [Rhodobacter sp. JA431]
MTQPNEPLPQPDLPPHKKGFLAGLRASFLTGLVVLAPIALTLWLMWTIAGMVDGWVLPFIPAHLQPETYVGTNLRGVGVLIFLLFTLIVGALARNFIGRAIIRFGEGLVDRTPIVRSIYNGVKQIAETVLSTGETKFDRACIIEYPRKGLRAIAFVSSKAKGEVAATGDEGDPLVSVFLPTTPNPTSGFLLFVPESEITYLDMSVEDAAKLVISAGLVYPSDKKIVEQRLGWKTEKKIVIKPSKDTEAA